MKNKPTFKLQPRWDYLGKILLTGILYYSTSRLGDFFTFIHVSTNEQFQAFWGPSGVAFGMIILFGRAAWPGILLASIVRTPLFSPNIGTHAEIINTAIVSATIAAGRVIEPLVGYALIKRFFKEDKSFATLGNSLRFIAITLVISIIGASISASIIQVFRQDTAAVFVSRLILWYSNNVFGILLFTPLVISISQISKLESSIKKSIGRQVAILLSIVSLLFLIDIQLFLSNPILLRSLYLLFMPIVLWLAFQYHLSVSSLAVIFISILSVYFTSLDTGPFIGEISSSDSAILMKLFMITITLSMLLASAASNERKKQLQQIEVRAAELKNTNEVLLKILEDLERAKAKAEESDRLKSSFLANMSHEIRTPMNAIMGISELLERNEISEEKRRDLTRLIRERSEALLSIITGILLISELEANKRKSIWTTADLKEFFTDLKNDYSKKIQIEKDKTIDLNYTINLPDEYKNIVVDLIDLKLTLSYLLDNAIKFTRQGSIEFSCSVRDTQTLLFTVSDTGIGIPEDKFSMIFKAFSYADENIHLQHGGTGLGLAICKMLISNWGGEISVASTKGKGSIFSFTMPFKRNPA